jgi:hypothetical protein
MFETPENSIERGGLDARCMKQLDAWFLEKYARIGKAFSKTK